MTLTAPAVSRLRAKYDASQENHVTSARVILSGIIHLVEGQRAFAEELGLPYTCVFDEPCQTFRDKDPESILRDWLQDEMDGPAKFRSLLDDLIEHNLALCASLDAVALESLTRLSPPSVKADCFSVFGWRPFAWLKFCRLHKLFSINQYLRHQELVVNGFAKAYRAHRERLRASHSRPINRSVTRTEKEESS